jgi:hypothetical protein
MSTTIFEWNLGDNYMDAPSPNSGGRVPLPWIRHCPIRMLRYVELQQWLYKNAQIMRRVESDPGKENLASKLLGISRMLQSRCSSERWSIDKSVCMNQDFPKNIIMMSFVSMRIVFWFLSPSDHRLPSNRYSTISFKFFTWHMCCFHSFQVAPLNLDFNLLFSSCMCLRSCAQLRLHETLHAQDLFANHAIPFFFYV